MRRTAFMMTALMAALFFLAPTIAGAEHPWTLYKKGAFRAAQKAGKTIFVSVHADW